MHVKPPPPPVCRASTIARTRHLEKASPFPFSTNQCSGLGRVRRRKVICLIEVCEICLSRQTFFCFLSDVFTHTHTHTHGSADSQRQFTIRSQSNFYGAWCHDRVGPLRAEKHWESGNFQTAPPTKHKSLFLSE